MKRVSLQSSTSMIFHLVIQQCFLYYLSKSLGFRCAQSVAEVVGWQRFRSLGFPKRVHTYLNAGHSIVYIAGRLRSFGHYITWSEVYHRSRYICVFGLHLPRGSISRSTDCCNSYKFSCVRTWDATTVWIYFYVSWEIIKNELHGQILLSIWSHGVNTK